MEMIGSGPLIYGVLECGEFIDCRLLERGDMLANTNNHITDFSPRVSYFLREFLIQYTATL
jgi:hypothetical protein